MQISNIQENLTKTELIQRLQQIMQDAARAAQDVQTARGDERSRVAQTEVEDAQHTDQDRVREDGRSPTEAERRRRKKRQEKPDAEIAKSRGPQDHIPPSAQGRIIDVVV
jgi:hypothetical protein